MNDKIIRANVPNTFKNNILICKLLYFINILCYVIFQLPVLFIGILLIPIAVLMYLVKTKKI